MSEVTTELPVFLIPLQKSNMILPTQAVAEIIPYEPLQRLQDSPDWFLGFLAWRGIQVPVASFEMLSAERSSFSLVSVASASLVLIKAQQGQADLPFFALVAQTLPNQIRVTPDGLIELDDELHRTELVRARMQDQIVSIPDLNYIEDEIRSTAYQ